MELQNISQQASVQVTELLTNYLQSCVNQSQPQSQIFPQSIKKSSHYQEYIQYFSAQQNQADQVINTNIKNIQKCQLYNLTINQNYLKKRVYKHKFITPLIEIKEILHFGSIVNYYIYISKFRFQITLLHLTQPQQQLPIIGEGGYGIISEMKVEGVKIIAKRILFTKQTELLKFEQTNLETEWKIKPNKKQIQLILYEYGFYKMCSFLQIGPKIINKLGFDILCFENYAEFYMEQCQQIFDHRIQKDIKLALRVLHKLKIIHKDVKYHNILFSKSYNKFILIDFGLTHEIMQQLGQLSVTYKEGTYGYMCLEMQMMNANKYSSIDLYFNDMYGLQITLMKVKKSIKREVKYKRNKFQNNRFYTGILLINSMIDYDYEKLEQYLSKYEDLLNQQQLKEIISHLDFEQIKKGINMNQIFSKKSHTEIFLKKFRIRNTKILTKKQIQFLIRIYGINKRLLAYSDQFQQTNVTKLLKQKLRSMQQYEQNQNYYSQHKQEQTQSKLLKSLQRELKYLKQIAFFNASQKSQIQFCTVSLELMIRGKHFQQNQYEMIYNNLKNQVVKNNKIQLIICLTEICNSQNPTIDLLNSYLNRINFIIQTEQVPIIYSKIARFYLQMKDQSRLEEYKNYLNINNSKLFKNERYIQQGRNIYQIGRYFKLKHKIKEAIQIFHRSIQYSIVDQKNIDHIQTLNQIGSCYRLLNQIDKYQLYSQKTLQLYQSQDQYLLKIIRNVAEANYLKKNIIKAHRVLQDSLQIAAKLSDSHHTDLANYYLSLGYFCHNNYDFKKSQQYCMKSVKILIIQKQQNKIYLATLQLVAKIYHHQRKKIKEAIILLQQCLRIKKQIYGQQNQQMIKTLNLIAILCMNLQQYKQQSTYANRSVNLCDKFKLNNHFTIQAYNLLALSYYSSDIQNFKNITQKTLKIIKQNYGQNSIFAPYIYNNYGKYFWKKKNYDKAIFWYEKSICVKQKWLSKNHFDLINDLNEMGECYYQLNQYDKAIFYFQRSFLIIQKFYTKDYEKYFEMTLLLQDCYQKKSKFKKSISVLKEWLSFFRFNGHNKENFYEILFRTGYCWLHLEKYDNTIYFFKKYKQLNDQKNFEDKLYCQLKINHCSIFRFRQTQNHNYLKKINKMNIKSMKFNRDLEIYLKDYYLNTIDKRQSIMILTRLYCVQNSGYLKQFYGFLLSILKKQNQLIYKLVNKLENIITIKVNNQNNNLILLRLLKRYLLINKKYEYKKTYEQNINKIIFKILH